MLVASSFALVVGCSLQVPNVKTHVSLPNGKAYFKYLNSGREGFIEKQKWDLERIGMLCHSPDDFARVLEFMEKACLEYQNCTMDVKEKEEFEKLIVKARGESNE